MGVERPPCFIQHFANFKMGLVGPCIEHAQAHTAAFFEALASLLKGLQIAPWVS